MALLSGERVKADWKVEPGNIALLRNSSCVLLSVLFLIWNLCWQYFVCICPDIPLWMKFGFSTELTCQLTTCCDSWQSEADIISCYVSQTNKGLNLSQFCSFVALKWEHTSFEDFSNEMGPFISYLISTSVCMLIWCMYVNCKLKTTYFFKGSVKVKYVNKFIFQTYFTQ